MAAVVGAVSAIGSALAPIGTAISAIGSVASLFQSTPNYAGTVQQPQPLVIPAPTPAPQFQQPTPPATLAKQQDMIQDSVEKREELLRRRKATNQLTNRFTNIEETETRVQRPTLLGSA